MGIQPDTPEIVGMLVSSRLGTFLESTGLPRALGQIQNSGIIFARKGWQDDNFTVATITSFEVQLNRKIITLHLSVEHFLAGTDPVLWFEAGIWKLTIIDQQDKPFTFDDVEFALL